MDFKCLSLLALCCLQGCSQEPPQTLTSPSGEPSIEIQSKTKPKPSEVSIDTILKKGMSEEEAIDALKARPTEFLTMSVNWHSVIVTSPMYPGRYIDLVFWSERVNDLAIGRGGAIVYRLNSWSMVPIE